MLPNAPSLEWLRKQAKRRLDALRRTNPGAQLADAQFDLATEHGFASWRALKTHVDSFTVEGRLLAAARAGDATTLAALLDEHPDLLHITAKPYDHSLLHLAAANGHLAAVDVLLARGLDVNTRDGGDNAYAMHFAAGYGHLDVVRRLADAGGDLVGHGDDHGLEVIGWATCFEPCRDAVAELLVARGARHHLFSAIAMNLADEVRRIVAADPRALSSRMSRHDDHQLPLHFAVKKNQPAMVALLIDLGADPLAADGSGNAAAAYATSPDVDRPVMMSIRAMTAAEGLSAARGHRQPRATATDLMAALALHDWEAAERLVRETPRLIAPGVLHLMAKRNDTAAVTWLLDRGADPNARWAHWDAEVTPLHLAVLGGHTDVVGLLLKAGADPRIHDSKHDSDSIGWAEFFRRPDIAAMLKTDANGASS